MNRTPDSHPAAPSRKEILAASAPWLAALLNVFPGLGTGYLYQRRWRAYWISALLATFGLGTNAWIGADTPPDLAAGLQLPGALPLVGVLALSGITAIEAFLAGRRSRMD